MPAVSAGRSAPAASAGSSRLAIPAAYLRRLRAGHPGLYDANVNGWLHRSGKSYLVRCLRGDRGGGVARAFLSSGYKIIGCRAGLRPVLDPAARSLGMAAEREGSSSGSLAVGRRLAAGLGVAYPKSRCWGCEPAALA